MIGVTGLDRGVLGILNDSPANAFAYWVMVGITDLDGGVLGILNDPFGSGVFDFGCMIMILILMWSGVSILGHGWGHRLGSGCVGDPERQPSECGCMQLHG